MDELSTGGENALGSDDSTRAIWCGQKAQELQDILGMGEEEEGGESITAEQAMRLAATMYDMEVDDALSGVEPAVVLMRELLMQQGLDDVTAIVVARALMRVDLSKLTVSSRKASELLDVTPVTLLRHRQSGRWLPAAEHKSIGKDGKVRSESVIYWLAGILHVIAWRRKHPRTGGAIVWFPPQIRPGRASS